MLNIFSVVNPVDVQGRPSDFFYKTKCCLALTTSVSMRLSCSFVAIAGLPCSNLTLCVAQLGTHLRAKKKREEMSALMRKAQQKK